MQAFKTFNEGDYKTFWPFKHWQSNQQIISSRNNSNLLQPRLSALAGSSLLQGCVLLRIVFIFGREEKIPVTSTSDLLLTCKRSGAGLESTLREVRILAQPEARHPVRCLGGISPAAEPPYLLLAASRRFHSTCSALHRPFICSSSALPWFPGSLSR